MLNCLMFVFKLYYKSMRKKVMAKNTFSVKNDMQYLFKPKVSLSKIERKKKRRAWAFAIGSVLVLIQLVLTVLFLLKMFKLDILPFKYLFMINIILILLVLYDFTSQFTKSHILGKLISVMLSCLILFTYLFAAKFDSVLDKLGAANVEIDIVDVCVLSNDKAQNLNDAANYKFAINSTASNANINTSIESISSETGKTIKPTEYTNWSNLVNALYDNKNVQAIVINHSMMSIISQEFPDFEDSIKIIKTYEYKEKVELDASNVNVKRDPFIIYVSGISSDDGEDTKLASKALSDVNILAVINPETKQVLLVTTPRDSYIKISNSSGVTGYDKLAHAGSYGVDKSIEALENLYGINIDYYVKINFAGSQAVIDALGGITIESEIEFTNGWEAAPVSYHFVQGANECDGEKAIAFARERKAFAAGDFQRGRNQTAVIKGIIQKATSPAILTRYSAVMDTVSDMFLTNIPSSAISDLVKLQLSNSTPWNIQTYSISGKTDEYRHLEVSNVYGASIVLPYEEDISTATKLMNKVIAGETFDVDTYLNSDN
ncbi:MAG TPA: LytR family transcriptional regulator [Eubacterium sp.]|nr:LytR family transcriptional regulator [Eubacterium sp.]